MKPELSIAALRDVAFANPAAQPLDAKVPPGGDPPRQTGLRVADRFAELRELAAPTPGLSLDKRIEQSRQAAAQSRGGVDLKA